MTEVRKKVGITDKGDYIEVFYFKCDKCGKEIISLNEKQFAFNVGEHKKHCKKGVGEHGDS